MTSFLSPDEWEAVRLSLLVATGSVTFSLPFGIVLGYILARKRFWGKAIVETCINFSLVLPPVVVGYGLLVFLGRKGIVGAWIYDQFGFTIALTRYAAIVAAAIVSFPLMVRSIRIAFQGIDPNLERAARTLGASPLNAFFTVSLPLAINGVIAGVALAFARSIGEFGATIVFAGNIRGETQTLSLAIFSTAEAPGGLEKAWPLVLIAIIFAAVSLGLSEYLEERASRHKF